MHLFGLLVSSSAMRGLKDRAPPGSFARQNQVKLQKAEEMLREARGNQLIHGSTMAIEFLSESFKDPLF